MLTKEKIEELLKIINSKMATKKAYGEILLCGGAVMCLVFQSRVSTKDIDGIFIPTKEIRDIISEMSQEYNLPENWLNDAVKGFFYPPIPQIPIFQFSHLKVYRPTPEYLLAMKCISARYDSMDKDDVITLIKYLNVKTPHEVFTIIEEYYPENKIPLKTQFFLEELFI